jgi:DNA polymerase-3 subunit beta
MKVICTQENLKNGLLTTGRIISPSNTLPVLNNFLLKTEHGQLKISSTNLEIAITTQIRCKIEEEGEVTVYAKTFSDLVSNLPNTNLSLETKPGELKIETESYHTSIKTLPAEDFPLIPQIEKNNTILVSGKELKKALDQVIFAASSNQTQPEISGIMFSFGKELKIAATDRYRLAEKRLSLEKKLEQEQVVIVPQKTAQELSRIVGNLTPEAGVEIIVNQNQISFDINQTQIISRLVDGQYPDYQQIIPTDFKVNIQVEKKPLVSALKAGGIFSQAGSSVVFGYGDGKIQLSSESADVGSSQVVVPAEVSGEPGQLLLNFHYVLDCLNALDVEKINIKIIDDNSPALILPEGQQDYVYLVMPIKN